jgi:hypothetical protein
MCSYIEIYCTDSQSIRNYFQNLFGMYYFFYLCLLHQIETMKLLTNITKQAFTITSEKNARIKIVQGKRGLVKGRRIVRASQLRDSLPCTFIAIAERENFKAERAQSQREARRAKR